MIRYYIIITIIVRNNTTRTHSEIRARARKHHTTTVGRHSETECAAGGTRTGCLFGVHRRRRSRRSPSLQYYAFRSLLPCCRCCCCCRQGRLVFFSHSVAAAAARTCVVFYAYTRSLSVRPSVRLFTRYTFNTYLT